MVAIKRQWSNAYILLESLAALFVFSFLVGSVLMSVGRLRQQQAELQQTSQAYSLVQMAVQTGKTELELNGVRVTVEKSATSWRAFSDGKELLHVVKK